MSNSRLRELFERHTEAFNGHDLDAFAEDMADDVSVRAPGGVELRGRASVKAFYGSWVEAFPDARVRIDAAHFTDDVVVEEGTFCGTHQGTLRGPQGDLPPTGRTLRAGYVQVVRYRGDQIASFHLLYDRAELMEQLGGTASEEEDASTWEGEASESVQPN